MALNVTVIFEKENINTDTMESELMLFILSSLAESESVSISENNKWSIQKRFQNGTYIISYPPYGYENAGGEMIVVPEQAEVVKKIFEDTLAGKSTHAVAKELNDSGVRSKKGRKMDSRRPSMRLFAMRSLREMLFFKRPTPTVSLAATPMMAS